MRRVPLSLSIKLPLVLSIVVAAVAATIGITMVDRDRQRLREELNGHAVLLARTVAAIAARRPIAVFPFYARVLWWIERLSPRLMDAALRVMMREQRRRFGSSISS